MLLMRGTNIYELLKLTRIVFSLNVSNDLTLLLVPMLASLARADCLLARLSIAFEIKLFLKNSQRQIA